MSLSFRTLTNKNQPLLNHYGGISGSALKWFKSYLTNRTFSVRICLLLTLLLLVVCHRAVFLVLSFSQCICCHLHQLQPDTTFLFTVMQTNCLLMKPACGKIQTCFLECIANINSSFTKMFCFKLRKDGVISLFLVMMLPVILVLKSHFKTCGSLLTKI